MALLGTITAATALLCLVLVVDSSRGKAASSGAQSCCTSYTRSPVPIYRITGFKTQTILENCNMDAIIFYTVKKNQICANKRDPWVLRALNMLSYQLKKMAQAHPAVEKKMKMDKSVSPVTTSTSGEFLSTTEN